ncbi:MAG: transcriptional regulator [Desulfurococcales archaeon]|nr:transcriptional regulator [Desulfurococcales archaeon]
MVSTVKRILESIAESPKAPGDVVAETRLPRYLVLASMKCLEELGLIEPLYARGSYKIYVTTALGEIVLKEGNQALIQATRPAGEAGEATA